VRGYGGGGRGDEQVGVADGHLAARRLVPAEGVDVAEDAEPDHDFDAGGGFVGGAHGVDVGPDVEGDVADGAELLDAGYVDGAAGRGVIVPERPLDVEVQRGDVLQLEGQHGRAELHVRVGVDDGHGKGGPVRRRGEGLLVGADGHALEADAVGVPCVGAVGVVGGRLAVRMPGGGVVAVLAAHGLRCIAARAHVRAGKGRDEGDDGPGEPDHHFLLLPCAPGAVILEKSGRKKPVSGLRK